MSLFKRFMDALTGREDQTAARSTTASQSSVRGGEAGVAVLDPPDAAQSDEPQWFASEDATLTELQSPIAPEESHELTALSNMLFNKLDGGDLDLPPLPRVAQAALKELRSKNCDLRKVADIIAKDQATATRILRAVNSAIYGSLKITSLPQATVRLGIQSLKTIMMSESLRSVTLSTKQCDRNLAQIVWQRALASGCIMQSLAPLAGVDSDDAFVIGLLHDIGNVIALRVAGSFEKMSGSRVGYDVFDYVSHQYHQEFGELIADAWDLPLRVKTLVGHHHEYPADDAPYRKEHLLLIVTDMINQMVGYDTPTSYRLLESKPVRDLGLADDNRLVEALISLPQELEDNLTSL